MTATWNVRIAAPWLAPLLVACGSSTNANRAAPTDGGKRADDAAPSNAEGGTSHPRLPLTLVADVPLPGGATRFDYQAVDGGNSRLVISHMNDGSVLFVDLADGSVLKELTGIPVARGVAVASDVGLVFVTASPSTLVVIDADSMTETTRVATGNGPDGVGWDPVDAIVGVSDQGDGALSLIADSGKGARRQVELGRATGNVVFDPDRRRFWITVEAAAPPDRLVAVDPLAAVVETSIELTGCSGAHGLRLHPDAKSAFVACEANAKLLRVDLEAGDVTGTSPTGAVPDVITIDPGLGWLYVAAESGDLTVFDIERPGAALIGHDQPGNAAHSVAVDPATHHVFFPLTAGPEGTPILRILKPSGL